MSDSSPESPPPSQWPISLEHLLNSSTGKNLFLEYLRNEDEGLSFPLLFLLAVEGLQDDNYGDKQMINLINLIYESLLPSVSCISQESKEAIRNSIVSPTVNIYDHAVEEVREHMSENLYPNFLKSEFYLAAINQEHGVETSSLESDARGVSSDKILQNQDELVTSLDQQDQATTCSSSHLQRDLQTVHEEEVLSLKHPKPFQLTKEILLSTQRERAKKGTAGGPLNPYHAQYSSYNPVSRQDSEIQSLSSGCTDEPNDHHRRVRRRVLLAVDELPPVPKHKPLPKREGYSKYTKAEVDPVEFAKELVEKLQEVVKISSLERNRRFDWSSRYQQQQQLEPNIVVSHRQPNQSRLLPKPGYEHPIDKKTLATHLRKLQDACGEQDEQEILDQHVSRVWADPTPEFSRSPRNEASDSRKPRRGHSSSAAGPSTAALIKGKSVQTLDSGIGGDKEKFTEHRAYRVRPLPPVPRWNQEQFFDSGMSDTGRSSIWEPEHSSRTVTERPRSGESGPTRRVPQLPSSQSQPVPHRRHSPPTEDFVSVLVHYEYEHEKPFLIKMAKTKLTLGVLKSKVPKKGNWKYLFKLGDADDKSKQINYELKRDEDLLPLFREECVFVILKSIQPPESSNKLL